MSRDSRPIAVEQLVALKADFLRFVRARTGSQADAEDLLIAGRFRI